MGCSRAAAEGHQVSEQENSGSLWGASHLLAQTDISKRFPSVLFSCCTQHHNLGRLAFDQSACCSLLIKTLVMFALLIC